MSISGTRMLGCRICAELPQLPWAEVTEPWSDAGAILCERCIQVPEHRQLLANELRANVFSARATITWVKQTPRGLQEDSASAEDSAGLARFEAY